MISSLLMAIPMSAAQIADDLERRIHAGEFEPGDVLPTYTQLASDYRVSRSTIATVIVILKERALVEGSPGRAVFVR